MLRDRLEVYRDRVRRKLLAAFREERTPHQVAASFALGIFLTALPTGGLGVGLFFVFTSLWSWISTPAIFASVAVLNPFVKPVVYVASFQLGGVVLGTPPLYASDFSAETAQTAIHQLIVGNILVAVVLSGAAYLLLLYLARNYRWRTCQLSTVSFGSKIRRLFGR
ncbi:DUF2062 domain-containing protein [Natronobacterium gregoryi]|uniref:DUF2062 domain-containing protein n=2 Tax=Natronobacterium gregoryi TaxID=44930 RepID=L0AD51_NATGS|nr:DUF2062 domain-containing protein [Natronobacterium gregoryi]AFZ71828.1 hypothetical protein Natgr_0578 [Natronobacterium gregoryi SP2]ELY72998.1 hypothetical protein C490_02136 [Natronobacterium gregoryi SP2]PLK19139.1 DUF2062 domain-containing protein [Natronobacterium gregoryi SP2]SFJ60516.1 hypothetical protein SAMN05443661_14518 [Natronobacterium gregoryi]